MRVIRSACVIGLSALTALAIYVPPALAQAGPGADIDLQTFRPALDSRGFVTVNGAHVLGHGQLSLGLVSTWGRNLLRFSQENRVYAVEHMITPTLVGAVGVRLPLLPFDLELGASLPFAIMAGDREPNIVGVPDNPNDNEDFGFDGQGIGDIGIHAKIRLSAGTAWPHVASAVIVSLHVPTATEKASWLGASALRPHVGIALERDIGRLTAAVNAGVRIATGGVTRFRDDVMMTESGQMQPVTGQSIAVGTTAPLGAALAFRLVPQRFDVIAEVFGELPFAGENYQPAEAIAGIKLYLADSSFLTLGGGTGLARTSGGSPDVRAFIGIVFEPRLGDRDGDGIKDDVDACPDNPEDHDDFEDSDGCPDVDNDRDGIVDADDACPNEPEDRDGEEDSDGCPETSELDRDGDGILDEEDECPDDPEDVDGFADRDGCPDVDNDGDGIDDVDDLCPDEAEDTDSWEDNDGCPEPDNDRDRIVDTNDECPIEPEVYNTFEDDDGCPDRGEVGITDGKLLVLKEIYFEYDSAVIKAESHAILGTIAATINLNPDITLIEVQGHTDERGSESYNLKLSQARAEAVVSHLASQGVAGGRLRARGYGESVPLDRRNNQEAWAKNRRVEFVIVTRSSD